MNKTIEQIKQYGEGKKEFTFIKSVADYISENYGEIQDSFTTENIEEVIGEIANTLTLAEMFCTYEDAETLKFFSKSHTYIHCDNEKEGLDKFYTGYMIWNLKLGTTLSELYYISDIKTYDAWVEENRQAEIAKELSDKQQAELDRQAKVVEDVRLREKFSLDREADTTNAKLFEQLFEGDNLGSKLEVFSKFISSSDIDWTRVRNIAEEYAEAAIEEHVSDHHDW